MLTRKFQSPPEIKNTRHLFQRTVLIDNLKKEDAIKFTSRNWKKETLTLRIAVSIQSINIHNIQSAYSV